jgi:hypothetical protein
MAGGLRPPIEVIASWKINYTNPERSGGEVIVITAVLLGLVWLVFLMRMWARFKLIKSAGIDDALIIFTMVCSIDLLIERSLIASDSFNRHGNRIVSRYILCVFYRKYHY